MGCLRINQTPIFNIVLLINIASNVGLLEYNELKLAALSLISPY